MHALHSHALTAPTSTHAALAAQVLLNDDSRHIRGGDLSLLLGALSDVDTVLLSPDTHELRAYNRLATLSAADYLVFVQDDTLPPLPTADISWLAHSSSLFLRWPQAHHYRHHHYYHRHPHHYHLLIRLFLRWPPVDQWRGERRVV